MSSIIYIGYPEMPTLAEKLRALRKERGWTLEEVAERVSASKSSLWELENKAKGRPSADRVTELAKIYGVTPEFLLDEDAAEATTTEFDDAFFRRFQSLPEPTKKQLKGILDLLDTPKKKPE
jgi:transcriptional regulator with XRE-family HTH domain